MMVFYSEKKTVKCKIIYSLKYQTVRDSPTANLVTCSLKNSNALPKINVKIGINFRLFSANEW